MRKVQADLFQDTTKQCLVGFGVSNVLTTDAKDSSAKEKAHDAEAKDLRFLW